ncbi:MAG: Fic family protein [bacterium]|nr:Fic family protein [bacterium]
MNFTLNELPPHENVETLPVLKQAVQAHRFLAELKGVSKTIPNQNILIYTLPLIEAKDSSAIENIITTYDELYKENLFGDFIKSPAAKKVRDYASALLKGYIQIKEKGLLTNNVLLEVQAEIEKSRAGFRKLPGTELKNEATGETIYTPPQNPEDILNLMGNLEKFINDDTFSSYDSLVKMAIIHYQFESIHPFYDGNGRTGRILNILYLVHQELLEIPVLYLSRYIIQNKSDYYRLLQEVRDYENWEGWILYMLKGIEVTARDTIDRIGRIRILMMDYKQRIRKQFKFYSQDLLNNLFCHPYTKIEFLEKDLNISRKTAAKYLDTLSDEGFLMKEKIGVHNFYINRPLFDIFIL